MGAHAQGQWIHHRDIAKQHAQRQIEPTLDEFDQGPWFVVTPQGCESRPVTTRKVAVIVANQVVACSHSARAWAFGAACAGEFQPQHWAHG